MTVRIFSICEETKLHDFEIITKKARKISYNPTLNKCSANTFKKSPANKVKEDFIEIPYELYKNIACELRFQLEMCSSELTHKQEKIYREFIKRGEHTKFGFKQYCKYEDKCLIWHCPFIHPDTRPPECECKIETCRNLHRTQAICKNPNHKDGCSMSHSLEALLVKNLDKSIKKN